MQPTIAYDASDYITCQPRIAKMMQCLILDSLRSSPNRLNYAQIVIGFRPQRQLLSMKFVGTQPIKSPNDMRGFTRAALLCAAQTDRTHAQIAITNGDATRPSRIIVNHFACNGCMRLGDWRDESKFPPQKHAHAHDVGGGNNGSSHRRDPP